MSGIVALVFWLLGMASTAGLSVFSLKLYRQNQQLAETSNVESHAAMHDPLTGVANRRQFEQRLDNLVNDDKPNHVLLMLDLDRFKPINDLHGHAAGDALLIEISNGLASIVGSKDTVARLGGDEFAILLKSTNAQVAEAVATRALDFVAKFRLNWEGNRLSVGTSIGMVAIDAPGNTSAALMAVADEALYAAKEAGRGVAFIATPGDSIGEPYTFEKMESDVTQPAGELRSHEPEDGRQPELYANEIAYLNVPNLEAETRSGSRRRHNIKHWVLTQPRTIGDHVSPGMQVRELIENAATRADGGANFARWVLVNTLNAASRFKPAEIDQLGFVLPIPAHAVITEPKLGEELMRINALAHNPLRHYTFLLYGVGALYNAPEIQEFQKRLAVSDVGLAFEITSSTLDVLAPLNHAAFDEVYLGRQLSRNLRPGTPAFAGVESLLAVAKQGGTAVVASNVETEEEVRHLAHMGVFRFSGEFIGEPAPLYSLLSQLHSKDEAEVQATRLDKSA